jgi:death-on-curing protein
MCCARTLNCIGAWLEEMRILTLSEVLQLQRMLLEQSGGIPGLRDQDGLQSALAQPEMSFGGEDLYPSLPEKAAALAFSLVKNHPFLDGNKRIGHAAMEVFLLLNGHEIAASCDEQEALIMRLAASKLDRDELTEWLQAHVQRTGASG